MPVRHLGGNQAVAGLHHRSCKQPKWVGIRLQPVLGYNRVLGDSRGDDFNQAIKPSGYAKFQDSTSLLGVDDDLR